MSVGLSVMLLGLFGVPAVLLWLGHRLRRRTPRRRAIFWWALGGYIVAMVVATVAAFWPPAHWSEADTARGLAGFWAMVLLPVVGAVVGAVVRVGEKRRR